ncbi:hypothetical protein Trydic_g3395 [Trypoxylus dichotomus]
MCNIFFNVSSKFRCTILHLLVTAPCNHLQVSRILKSLNYPKTKREFRLDDLTDYGTGPSVPHNPHLKAPGELSLMAIKKYVDVPSYWNHTFYLWLKGMSPKGLPIVFVIIESSSKKALLKLVNYSRQVVY